MNAADRAQIIAERDAQIIAWLGKKAAEYGSSNRDSRTAAEAIVRMADKLSRGAVRDDETGLSELYRLRSENNQLRNDITGACLARYEEEQENAALRARIAELEGAATCPSVARIGGSKCVLPVRHRGDHRDETKRHYWSDDYAVPRQRQLEDPHDGPNHHDYALSRDLPFIPNQQDRRAP